MKIQLILLTSLFFFSFDSFGQVDSCSIILDSAYVLNYKIESEVSTTSLFSFYSCEPMDSSSIITKKNGDKLIECYTKETQMIKSRTLLKSNSRWNRIVKKTIWDENGKILCKYIFCEKYIPFELTNLVPGRNSNVKEIKSRTWYYINNGKLCLKRKKETRTIIYHTK